MTWFTTSKFSFELPGDEWLEETIHIYRKADDRRSAFAISRTPLSEEEGLDLERALDALPAEAYDERKVLRSEFRQVGPLDAQDVGVLTRRGAEAEYYRLVSVAYYDLEVTFQFAGPVAARDEVDARVERTLETVRFRER